MDFSKGWLDGGGRMRGYPEEKERMKGIIEKKKPFFLSSFYSVLL